MSLLNIQNLTYHIGDKTLYQNAEFALYPDEHVGVTGKNGVGKSTLFK
ncbi:ATP-binding cassette domain-containing protein, partial [Vibrio cidicii]